MTVEETLHIERPALDVAHKRNVCLYQKKEEPDLKSELAEFTKSQIPCFEIGLKGFIQRRIPILQWLPRYQWKRDLIGDTVSGITVAVVQIPLGMGFALLASIPPICGIYMAFFQVIAYAILASSQHNSMGAFAIITMMTGKVVNEYATFPGPSSPSLNETTSLNDLEYTTTESFETTSLADSMEAVETYEPVQVATIVCFMTGVWSVLLGFFGIGSATVFFNDMLVSAFSFGSAIHVLTSQIPQLLGIKIGRHSGPFKVPKSYIDIFSNIADANIATVIVSAIAITLIACNNEILKPRLAKLTRIPLPIELVIVIIGTTLAYTMDLPANYGVEVVGTIPTGLPAPTVPPMALAKAVAIDSLIIAIVAYAGSISLAKIFAEKHNYRVDPNQELYAMGFGNIFSSFFACGPMASAIARALIQDSAGGVTQLAGLVASFVLLWVLLFIGPLFEFLPKACLSSIIVVALKSMFLLILVMISMWKKSRIDAIIWIVTALGVVVIDVSYGLIIGVVFAVGVIISRGQHQKMTRMGRIPNTELYVDLNLYGNAIEERGMIIVHIEGPLHFANRENFAENLKAVANIAPRPSSDDGSKSLQSLKQTQHLILDCKGMGGLDALGAKLLAKISTVYKSMGVTVSFAGLSEEALGTMEKMGATENSQDCLFHSVHDAVILLNQRNRSTIGNAFV